MVNLLLPHRKSDSRRQLIRVTLCSFSRFIRLTERPCAGGGAETKPWIRQGRESVLETFSVLWLLKVSGLHAARAPASPQRGLAAARGRGNPAGAKAAPGPALQRAGEQMYRVWEVMLKHGLRGACRIWCWFVCCKRWSWHQTRGGSVLPGWQWVLSLPGCSCCHQSHCQALQSQLLQAYCFASLCLIEMERRWRD